MGLRRWSPWVSAGWSPWVVSTGGLCRSLRVVVGKTNQSKSVPMMSLNVVGNITQSNSRHLCRCLCGSPWISAVGLCGWSPRVVSMGPCGSLWVVSTGDLRGSLQVSMGLCKWSLWVVSAGSLCESLQVVSVGVRGKITNQNLCQ